MDKEVYVVIHCVNTAASMMRNSPSSFATFFLLNFILFSWGRGTGGIRKHDVKHTKNKYMHTYMHACIQC